MRPRHMCGRAEGLQIVANHLRRYNSTGIPAKSAVANPLKLEINANTPKCNGNSTFGYMDWLYIATT